MIHLNLLDGIDGAYRSNEDTCYMQSYTIGTCCCAIGSIVPITRISFSCLACRFVLLYSFVTVTAFPTHTSSILTRQSFPCRLLRLCDIGPLTGTKLILYQWPPVSIFMIVIYGKTKLLTDRIDPLSQQEFLR